MIDDDDRMRARKQGSKNEARKNKSKFHNDVLAIWQSGNAQFHGCECAARVVNAREKHFQLCSPGAARSSWFCSDISSGSLLPHGALQWGHHLRTWMELTERRRCLVWTPSLLGACIPPSCFCRKLSLSCFRLGSDCWSAAHVGQLAGMRGDAHFVQCIPAPTRPSFCRDISNIHHRSRTLTSQMCTNMMHQKKEERE